MDRFGILLNKIKLDESLPTVIADFVNKAKVESFKELKIEKGIVITSPINYINPSYIVMNHYNYIEESMLGIGYGYYLFSDFPRRMLPIVRILQESGIFSGIDIDENGNIRKSKVK